MFFFGGGVGIAVADLNSEIPFFKVGLLRQLFLPR